MTHLITFFASKNRKTASRKRGFAKQSKSALFVALLLFTLPTFSNAQLGNLVKRAKDKIASKANSRIDQKMDKTLDKTFDQIEGKNQQQPSATLSTNTDAKATTPEKQETAGRSSLSSYSTFDFKAGETVIYSNDFSGETLGESPIGWNSSGTGAVVKIEGLDGNWLQLSRDAFYTSDNKASFTENFTVEFDLLLRRSDPKAIFSQLGFGIMTFYKDTITHRRPLNEYKKYFAAELKVQPYDYNGSHMHFESFENNNPYVETDIRKYPDLQKFINTPIHISMQVQGERLRIWFNAEKMYDLPQAIMPNTTLNQLFFFMKGNGSLRDDAGYNITNIRVAKGLADMRHKLVDEGKFSTAGILFTANSATMKPESYGVLKEIADVLKNNQNMRVKIVGHTDSDGNDATNLQLSKQRASAVKEMLVSDFGIAADRIETDGNGAASPVADNKTSAGKAQNRRVEFIKI